MSKKKAEVVIDNPMIVVEHPTLTFADVKLGQAFTLATDDFAYIKSGNSSAIYATHIRPNECRINSECRINGKVRISKKEVVTEFAELTTYIKNRNVVFRQVPEAIVPLKKENVKKSKSKKRNSTIDMAPVVS